MARILGTIASSFEVAGDFESISTVSVGSGGAANVEFTSIPATYTHLQIRSLAQTNRSSIGRDIVNININNDDVIDFTS